MPYGDFYVRYEHKFFRNIYSDEQITTSPKISNLENYYETYQKSLGICLSLQSILILHSDVSDIEDFDYETKMLLQDNYFDYLRKHIEEVEVKN